MVFALFDVGHNEAMVSKAKRDGADKFAGSGNRVAMGPTAQPFWGLAQAARRLMAPEGGGLLGIGDQTTATGLMLASLDAWCNYIAASANTARFKAAEDYSGLINQPLDRRLISLPTLVGLEPSDHDRDAIEAAVHLRNEIFHPLDRLVAPTGVDRDRLVRLCAYIGSPNQMIDGVGNLPQAVTSWSATHEWCWREMHGLVTSLATTIEAAVRSHPHHFAEVAFGLDDPFQTGAKRRLLHPFSCEPGWRELPYGLVEAP